VVLEFGAFVKVVGLTGGIGAGKSAVASCLEKLGVPVIDTDTIAHALTQVGGRANPSIGEVFGAEMLENTGGMARSKMRELVFADPAARAKLESILHPMIREDVDIALSVHRQSAKSAYVVLAVPLLFERMTFRASLWRTLSVDVAEATQVSRVIARSGLTVDAVCAIMRAQVPRQIRLQLADDIIHNDADWHHLQTQVEQIHQWYVQQTAADAQVPR
jgi:dephospho-CoA kinase